jgi:hypothetical protein
MPDITLRIEQSNSTFRPDGIEAEFTRSFKEQARGEVRVYREDWNNIVGSIDERNDKFFIEVDGTDEFGGRFDDAETNGATVSVRLNSPEIDAAQAEPTDDNVTFNNRFANFIAARAIGGVPTLSTGIVNSTKGRVSYSVSHGSLSKILYDLREMTGAEFRYNADFTVDFTDRLGSTTTPTIGPGEGNLGTGFDKTVDQRENVTHVRVLGGQSGPDQVTAEAVSSNYSGGRKVWRRYENKEIIDPTRAQDVADELIADYENDPRSVEVRCRIYDSQYQLGDTVTVDYPEENINQDLRIVSLTKEITRRGFIILATLSNRGIARENVGETKRNDDIQTHNRGHGGFVDRDQVTSGWNAAGDGTPQTLEVFNWPDDIVEEKTVTLGVQGRAWRSPVDPLSHEHSVSISDTSTDNSDLNNVEDSGTDLSTEPLSAGSGWTTVDTFTLNSSPPISALHAHIGLQDPSDDYSAIDARLFDQTAQEYYPLLSNAPTNSGVLQNIGEYIFVTAVVPSDVSGHTFEWQLETNFGNSSITYTSWFQTIGKHTHDVSDTTTTGTKVGLNPEVITTFNGNSYYPTDVEIKVNGTTITTAAGNNSQKWQETVDLSGELSPGQNTIAATPTGQRGSVNLTLASELFRRGEVS